jgi:hypothetical protein
MKFNWSELDNYIPEKINTWIEPFGINTDIHELFKDRIKYFIYNHPKKCNNFANEIYHMDWNCIIDKFNSDKTFFFIVPTKYNLINKSFSNWDNLDSVLDNIKSKFIMITDDDWDIRKRFKRFKIINSKSGTKIFIMNYDI